jgi:hypothetical protein
MRANEMNQAGDVVLLDVARERRRFIDLANANENWIQTVASFALEGIALTDDNAERAGRLLSGAITLEQGYEEIRRKYGLQCVTA